MTGIDSGRLKGGERDTMMEHLPAALAGLKLGPEIAVIVAYLRFLHALKAKTFTATSLAKLSRLRKRSQRLLRRRWDMFSKTKMRTRKRARPPLLIL